MLGLSTTDDKKLVPQWSEVRVCVCDHNIGYRSDSYVVLNATYRFSFSTVACMCACPANRNKIAIFCQHRRPGNEVLTSPDNCCKSDVTRCRSNMFMLWLLRHRETAARCKFFSFDVVEHAHEYDSSLKLMSRSFHHESFDMLKMI